MTRKVSSPHPPRKEKLKLSALVAKKIEQDIVRSGWQPGQVLATEPELIKRYGISRAVLREAISQVERKGIASMRRGHGGGLIVSESARTATIHALTTYLELTSADLGQMLEARALLDILSARLACENIGEKQVHQLNQELDKLSSTKLNLETAAQINLSIRRHIAEASGNPLISLFSDAIDNSCSDLVVFQYGQLYIFKDIRAKTAKTKTMLVKSIIAADEINAQQYARENIENQLSYYKNHLNKTRAELYTDHNINPSEGPIKLGHSVALRISHDIQVRQLPDGTRLGSEPELMEKYNISRAAFREAVRLLEAHAIVHARRGSGGGLTVGTPDPSDVIETVILYMGVMNHNSGSLMQVRESLELGAVQLAARRLTEEDRLKILQALDASESENADREFLDKTIALHQAIGDASHNRTLSLLLQVTLNCLARTYRFQDNCEPWMSQAKINHRLIVSALFDRNEGLAQRQMLRHLNMIRDWWLQQKAENRL